MKRRAAKAEVSSLLEDLLARLQPKDRKQLHHYEKGICTAVCKALKKRLNREFLKARWLKDTIKFSFDERQVNTSILQCKMIFEKITQCEYALIEAECSDMDSNNDVDSTSQDSIFEFIVSSDLQIITRSLQATVVGVYR